MRKCVFCKTRYRKGSKMSFHRFPSELSLRHMWLQNMKALNWNLEKTDSLCSKHFDTKCFIKHDTRTALKSGTVPTLFEGLFETTCASSTLQSMGPSPCSPKSQSPKRRGVKRMVNESMDSSTPSNLKSYLQESIRSDHDYGSSGTPKKTRIQYSVAHEHRYESSPRSSQKFLHRTKRSLEMSNTRVKALIQRVKNKSNS